MFSFFKKKDVQKYKIGDIVIVDDPIYSQFKAVVRSYNPNNKLYTIEIKELNWHNEYTEKEITKK